MEKKNAYENVNKLRKIVQQSVMRNFDEQIAPTHFIYMYAS